MHVSIDNLIRFPVMAAPVTPQIGATEASQAAEESPKIVAFAPIEESAAVDERSQEHGQLFVAHRIVGRIADQLDQVAIM